MDYILTSFLLFTAVVRSTPVPATSSRSCKDYSVPLNITSLNLQWGIDPIETNEDMAAFNAEWGRRDSASTFHPAVLPSNSTPEMAVYTISGTYCEPTSGGNGTVLLATHGAGYGRNYWDPDIQPENYSFVDYALAEGYSIFYYDRLGVGESEIVSGYVSQVSNQAAILTELVKLIRSGTFSSPPAKVVLLGHSFGSIVSNVALHNDPELVDAALLTGLAYEATGVIGAISNQAKQNRVANLYEPERFGKLDGGFAVWVDIYSAIENFFKVPFFDEEVVQWAQDNQQPAALLENLSIGFANVSSPAFTGPVMIMCGEYDFIACGGYCPGFIDADIHEVFPASKNVVAYVHPDSGHAINLSLNATGAFQVLGNFLKENGL
ncbi:Alpha/Beta hydrolase protein [Exophiala viscosa]|uniref:Alpha/Beta hydrolase protein n=1 Tax=Exophiala viscosa TaxID=2486360 RepID=UPI002192598A|nr:Alpha/Beta hydrolase protein [Exophiala viscosa]